MSMAMLVCIACNAAAAERCSNPQPPTYTPSPAQQERDEIYALLAYAVVYADWQNDNKRGYNIGAVLVDPHRPKGRQLLCWARNSVNTSRNGTQHGEVNLLTNYLHVSRNSKARGLRVYTTLEPCPMCAGMLLMQDVEGTLFGQSDPHFGRGAQILSSHCSFPKRMFSAPSTLPLRGELEAAFQAAGQRNITGWLATSQARDLFRHGVELLGRYRVQYSENRSVLAEAQAFLDRVPRFHVATPYTVACSG